MNESILILSKMTLLNIMFCFPCIIQKPGERPKLTYVWKSKKAEEKYIQLGELLHLINTRKIEDAKTIKNKKF